MKRTISQLLTRRDFGSIPTPYLAFVILESLNEKLAHKRFSPVAITKSRALPPTSYQVNPLLFESASRRERPAVLSSKPGGLERSHTNSSTLKICAEGIIRASAIFYNGSGPVNLGSGNEVVIRNLVEMIARLTGFTGEIRWRSDRPDRQPRRQLDTSGEFERFCFRARTKLEDGLKRTIEWYEQSRTEAGSD